MSLSLTLPLCSCGNTQKSQATDSNISHKTVPTFVADSAYAFCAAQCNFGYRTMNSKAHEDCGKWIADKFESYGLTITKQKADLKGYDGTVFHATNIIASWLPEKEARIILAAHWDTRPWADNDPNPDNHHKPVLGANDGASGVGVLLEIARIITQNDSLDIGIDFICFDAEDSGFPQWETITDPGDTWALGSRYWAENPHKPGYRAVYGVLLDMVGGRNAKFHKEGFSLHYAEPIVNKVWAAAAMAGKGSHFPPTNGGYITDDHVPVNEIARIPMVDIVPYYPDCQQSNFGPTWHTVNDTMENLDKTSLAATGQTILQLLYNEAGH